MTQVAEVKQNTLSAKIKTKRKNKFAYWFPHLAIPNTNPFRRSELGRVASLEQIQHTTKVWVFSIALVMCLLWLISAINVMGDSVKPWNDQPDSWFALGRTLTYGFGIIAVADRFLYDFIVVLLGINSINREITSGRWELISITDVNVEHIINAKHNRTQIQAWRATSIIMGLRLGMIAILFLHFLLGLTFSTDINLGRYFLDLSKSIIDNPLNLVTISLAILTFLITGGALIFEVRWRLRVLTAASMFTSSRTHATTMGIFYSLGMLLAFWVVQLFAVTFSFILMTSIFLPLDRWFFQDTFGAEVAFSMVFMLFVSAITTVTLIYIVYHEITDLWLTKATHRLIDRGGASLPRRYHPQRAYNVIFGLFILLWGFYALGTVYEANNPEYQFGLNELPSIYDGGVVIIVLGMALSIAFRLTLDFITLLASKRNNPRVQYTTGRSRIAREINLFLGIRIGVLCAGILHYMLGMKITENLTVSNSILGIGVFLTLLALQIAEVRWSQRSLARVGKTIENRFSWRFVKIIMIYFVMISRWVIYTTVLWGLIVGIRYSPVFSSFTQTNDVATNVLIFVLVISTLFGGLLFALHKGVQRLF